MTETQNAYCLEGKRDTLAVIFIKVRVGRKMGSVCVEFVRSVGRSLRAGLVAGRGGEGDREGSQIK